jgi:hypothetical protein
MSSPNKSNDNYSFESSVQSQEMITPGVMVITIFIFLSPSINDLYTFIQMNWALLQIIEKISLK